MYRKNRLINLSIMGLIIALVVVTLSFVTGATTQPGDVSKDVTIIIEAAKRIEATVNGTIEKEYKLANPALAEKGKPLHSPKQIDRPPIGDEKVKLWVVEARKRITDPRELDITIGLLNWKLGGNFHNSLKKQVIDWLDGKSTRQLSPKQLAWAGYITQPDLYPDPYTIKELYPNGNPRN